jgi:hypothetical protein
MSGALHQGRCYATADDAASAYWSSATPVINPGSPPSVSTFQHVSGSWHLITYQSGVQIESIQVPALSLASCDPGASAADGIALGFLVAAVWAAAWAVTVLRKPLES